jgi:hypothetical protein
MKFTKALSFILATSTAVAGFMIQPKNYASTVAAKRSYSNSPFVSTALQMSEKEETFE